MELQKCNAVYIVLPIGYKLLTDKIAVHPLCSKSSPPSVDLAMTDSCSLSSASIICKRVILCNGHPPHIILCNQSILPDQQRLVLLEVSSEYPCMLMQIQRCLPQYIDKLARGTAGNPGLQEELNGQ